MNTEQTQTATVEANESQQTGHTPGPWKYEPSTKTIRSLPTNYWLATMDSWDGAINNEANAHLIAAAPELLEACKDALNKMSEHGMLNPDNFLSRAIAKAEGKTNE